MDVAILLWIQEFLRADFMTGFWKTVTFLGDNGWFWIVLGVALFAWKRTRPVGAAVLLSLAMGALVTNVFLKNAVARIRPYDYTEQIKALIPPQHDFSFPSGHTCASFAAAVVCLKMLPRKYGICAVSLAVLIAFSRLYLGVHFFTDVLAGALIGAGAAWLACGIVKRYAASEKCKNKNE